MFNTYSVVFKVTRRDCVSDLISYLEEVGYFDVWFDPENLHIVSKYCGEEPGVAMLEDGYNIVCISEIDD